MKKGFTLIELLVVVLIIGILSAVALPQYTKAVEKSRLSEAQTNISSLEKAVDMYNMAGGDTSERDLIPLLDVDFSHLPAPPQADYILYCSKTWCYAALGANIARSQIKVMRRNPSGDFSQPLYVLHSFLEDGQWKHAYQDCYWTGGNIFASLKELGYQEWSC